MVRSSLKMLLPELGKIPYRFVLLAQVFPFQLGGTSWCFSVRDFAPKNTKRMVMIPRATPLSRQFFLSQLFDADLIRRSFYVFFVSAVNVKGK